MTTELRFTLADYAAGNYRVLRNLGDEFLRRRPPIATCHSLTRGSCLERFQQSLAPRPGEKAIVPEPPRAHPLLTALDGRHADPHHRSRILENDAIWDALLALT